MLGFLHDDIAHMREEEAGNVVLLAVLGNAVAAAGVHAGYENGVIALQPVFDGFEAVAFILKFFHDLIEALRRLALDAAKTLFIQVIPVDKQSFLGGIKGEVMAVGGVGPPHVKGALDDKQHDQPEGEIQMIPGQAGEEPHDHQAEELGDKLGEGQGADAGITQEIGVIHTVEKENEDAVAEKDKVIIAEAVFAHASEFAVAEHQPGDIERNKRKPKMKHLEQHDVVLFFIIRHDETPSDPL